MAVNLTKSKARVCCKWNVQTGLLDSVQKNVNELNVYTDDI